MTHMDSGGLQCVGAAARAMFLGAPAPLERITFTCVYRGPALFIPEWRAMKPKFCA